MSDPKKQHIIPKVYLKYFQNGNNAHVYCLDFTKLNDFKVREYGLNHPIFKANKFYNLNNREDPYEIEKFLGSHVEPMYNHIMADITTQKDFSKQGRFDFINWLFYAKHRSRYLRSMLTDIATWSMETMSKLRKEDVPSEETKRMAGQMGKSIHLNQMTNSKEFAQLFMVYTKYLLKKQWIVLMTSEEKPFWTNDNPGFSPNRHLTLKTKTPFHPIMEMSEGSINYFPLSPLYCFKVIPSPIKNHPVNNPIIYMSADPKEVDFINAGVFYTKDKCIICNKKELLQDYVDHVKQMQK